MEVVKTSDTSPYSLKLKSHYSPFLQRVWRDEFKQEFESFRLDPVGGAKKVEAFQKFGFSKTKTPDYFEFLNQYLSELKVHNRSISDSLLPALVMVKGEVGQVTEHRLIVPGLDPWPKEEGFRFLKSNEIFNIPFRTVLEGVKRNRFPLMDSIHDLSHFLSYLQSPKYAKALVQAARKIPVLDKYPVHFSRRFLFALEFLTLADPKQVEKMSSLLLFPRDPRVEYSIDEYSEYFSRLNKKDLLLQAERLSQQFDSLLVDYGGGVYRSVEKNEVIKDQYLSPNDLFLSLVQLLSVFRNDRSELQRALMSPLMSEVLKQLLEIRNLSKEELQILSKKNQFLSDYFGSSLKNVSHKKLISKVDELIVQQVARMEYGLSSVLRISPEKWVSEMVVIEMKKDSEVARFIQGLYGPRSPLSQILEN